MATAVGSMGILASLYRSRRIRRWYSTIRVRRRYSGSSKMLREVEIQDCVRLWLWDQTCFIGGIWGVRWYGEIPNLGLSHRWQRAKPTLPSHPLTFY